MKQKIRFAQLYAAHAAFNRYAALIVAKASSKDPFAERKNRSDFFKIAENRVQSGGCSLPHSTHDAAIIVKESSQTPEKAKNQTYSGELNFFVESQNKYCQAFVEYVFSAWARRLSTGANSDYTRSPLLCGQTSE